MAGGSDGPGGPLGRGRESRRGARAHFLRGAATVLLLVGAQWGFEQAHGHRSLGSVVPWGSAFAGPALSVNLSAQEMEGATALEPGEQQRFLSGAQRGLLALADHLNRLRQIGTQALYQPEAVEPCLDFHRAVADLERFLDGAQSARRPLFADTARFVLREEDGRACLLDLSGFGSWLQAIGPNPLRDRDQVERSLAALDDAYYRLVALYRHVSGLLPQA
jgi:hypothetical protein